MTIFRIFFATLLLTVLLSACGQRGPLFLPSEDAPVQAPAQAGQAAETETDELERELDEENKLEDGNLKDEEPDGF